MAVTIAAFVLSGLVAPSLALGQQPTPRGPPLALSRASSTGPTSSSCGAFWSPVSPLDPKLTATPGSVFPDRTYILQLPRRSARPKPLLTENDGPVVGLAISAAGGSASGTYLIRYRSLLPPQRKAVVRATIAGFPAACTTYTTPALDEMASEDSERQWMDSQYVTIFVIVAILGLMAFALLTRLKHRV